MTEQLHQRLADLAGDAASPASVDTGDIWRAGKRRQRRRTAAAVAASVIVLAGVVGIGASVPRGQHDPVPVSPAPSQLHLPKHVYKPDPWSKGTDDLGEIGPLAAVGSAPRNSPVGWSDKREEPAALFGVSAADGTARFLDLGLGGKYRQPWDGPTTALSPDGTKVGFELERLAQAGNENRATVAVGWAIYDTLTGKLRILHDPAAKAVTSQFSDLTFTTDSQWLVTNYAPGAGASSNKADSFVLWNAQTGERVVAEQPGNYWQPNVGSAPRGLLWARKFDVFRFDPATGDRSSFTVPNAVVEASIGPDDRAFAYIGGAWTPGPDGGINGDTWRLYVGPDREHLRGIPAPKGGEVGDIIGWKDSTHVVLDDWHGTTKTVDVLTGETVRGHLPDFNGSAALASDYLANPMVAGVRPPDAQDPRTWWRGGLYVGVPLALFVLVLRRRREQR